MVGAGLGKVADAENGEAVIVAHEDGEEQAVSAEGGEAEAVVVDNEDGEEPVAAEGGEAEAVVVSDDSEEEQPEEQPVAAVIDEPAAELVVEAENEGMFLSASCAHMYLHYSNTCSWHVLHAITYMYMHCVCLFISTMTHASTQITLLAEHPLPYHLHSTWALVSYGI